MIALGGPVLGSATALAVGVTGGMMESQFLYALADFGFIVCTAGFSVSVPRSFNNRTLRFKKITALKYFFQTVSQGQEVQVRQSQKLLQPTQR